MKKLTALLLTLLISKITLGQDEYTRFIQALLRGDTVLAAQIEKNYANANKIEPINEYPFPVKNITEHIFKINMNVLKDSLLNFFETGNNLKENQHLRKIFYFYIDTIRMPVNFNAEASNGAIFSSEYFLQPNSSNDIYLSTMIEPWLSKYYYSNSQHVQYIADFVFKLSKIDENSTVVKVVAINPKVISGMGLGVHGPKYIYTKAQPTTIEEYSLLLFIADKLGDTTLLPLKLPNSQ